MQPSGVETQKREPFFRVLVVVLVLIGLMAAVDLGLARADIAERIASGRRLYEQGQTFVSHGQYGDAAERFREALTKERSNQKYQLALILAFQRLGRLDEAEESLTELLQKDPENGVANLAMARIKLARGKETDAKWYFHRAIYGAWPDGGAHRVAVRFELADLLAKRGEHSELLAEALPLLGEAPQDPATQRRVAHLLLEAGSYSRASDLYRQILKAHTADADAYAGLGDAAFAEGRYAQAQSTYLAAIRLGSQDPALHRRFGVSAEILALDPQARRLQTGERYQRSRKLLEVALQRWETCAAKDNAASSAANDARAALEKKRESQESDAVERNIVLSERVWKEKEAHCPGGNAPADEPLALLLSKLSQ